MNAIEPCPGDQGHKRKNRKDVAQQFRLRVSEKNERQNKREKQKKIGFLSFCSSLSRFSSRVGQPSEKKTGPGEETHKNSRKIEKKLVAALVFRDEKSPDVFMDKKMF